MKGRACLGLLPKPGPFLSHHRFLPLFVLFVSFVVKKGLQSLRSIHRQARAFAALQSDVAVVFPAFKPIDDIG